MGSFTGEVKHRRSTREVPMITTSASAAVVVVEPVFTEPERLAVAGFLACYTGEPRPPPG
jgi:hypothetical protein